MSDTSLKVAEMGPAWRRHLRLGLGHLQNGYHQRATRSFERAWRDAPDEPEVQLALGRQRIRQERFDEAERLLRLAAAAMPDSAAAVAALARLLGLHRGRGDEAFAVIHALLKRDPPDDAPLHVVRGELLLEDNAYLQARAAFGRALDGDVASEAARKGLARTYNSEGIALSEGGEDERALFAFKSAADIDPLWSGPLVNRGVAFGRLGRLTRALRAYQNALERDPQNPVAHFNLAITYQELGQRKDAVEGFESLLELCPDYPHVRAALANVLGECGEFDRAIALLLDELEQDDSSASNWCSLGLAYVCSGNTERGEQCLRQALTLQPDHLNAHFNLAALYVGQQRYDDTEALLRRAFHVDPACTTQRFLREHQFDVVRGLDQFRFLARE